MLDCWKLNIRNRKGRTTSLSSNTRRSCRAIRKTAIAEAVTDCRNNKMAGWITPPAICLITRPLQRLLPGECVCLFHSQQQRAIFPRLEIYRLGGALIVGEHRFQFGGRFAAQYNDV